MNSELLKSVVENTASDPYIKWNDESLLEKNKNDNVYNVFFVPVFQRFGLPHRFKNT